MIRAWASALLIFALWAAPLAAESGIPVDLDPDALPPWASRGWTRPDHLKNDFVVPPLRADPGPPAAPSLIRPMPYPFAHAISISADADLSSYFTVELFETLFAHRYGLNVAQSFFYQAASGGATGKPGPHVFVDQTPRVRAVEARSLTRDIRSDMLFLRLMYRGAFDFSHSYSDDGSLPFALCPELSTTCSGTGASSATFEVPQVIRRTLAPSLGLHAIVECDEGVSRVEVVLVDRGGSEFVLDPFGGGPASSRVHFARFYPDIKRVIAPGERTPPGSWDPTRTIACAVKLVVEGKAGARVRLIKLRAVTLTREMVETQARLLRRLGLTQSVNIRHGGFTGQSGHSQLKSTGLRERTRPFAYQVSATDTVPCEQVWSADDPLTPFYHLDLLQSMLGVEFTDTNSGDTKDAKPAAEILVQEKGLDGRDYYRLNRISADDSVLQKLKLGVPKTQNDCIHSLGSMVEQVLGTMRNKPAHVGILYTHFASFIGIDRPEPTVEYPCHPNTVKGIELLHLRHYNPFGDVPAGDRVWVTKLPSLLRFLAVFRSIASHATVDFEGSRVQLSSWTDPVLGRTLPTPGVGAGELHGQTFHVKDAYAATVTLDGRPITCIKRNPADASGRASVTLIDDSFACALLHEVDPARSGEVKTDGGTFTSGAGGLLRGRSHFVLRADQPRCRMEFDPTRLSTVGASYLRLILAKSNPASRFTITLEDRRGVITTVREDGAPANESQGWTVPPLPAGEAREVVLDLADMASPKAGPKIVPHGTLKRMAIEMEGAKAGDELKIEAIDVLAENPRPLHLRGTNVVIAGKVESAAPDQMVHLEVGGRDHVTLTDAGGYFLFPAIPRGSVAEIWVYRDGKKIHPHDGSAFLALSDRADLEL